MVYKLTFRAFSYEPRYCDSSVTKISLHSYFLLMCSYQKTGQPSYQDFSFSSWIFYFRIILFSSRGTDIRVLKFVEAVKMKNSATILARLVC